MKKLTFVLLFLALAIAGFAQEKCTFFIDNGAKQVTELLCGTFTDLMVKVPLPKTAPNFDKVVVHYANSTKPNEISRVEFEGAGALKTVAGTTKNLWIHDPSNTSGTQGGAHGDFNLEINDAYVNMNCLCTYPKRDRFESITITIKAV